MILRAKCALSLDRRSDSFQSLDGAVKTACPVFIEVRPGHLWKVGASAPVADSEAEAGDWRRRIDYERRKEFSSLRDGLVHLGTPAAHDRLAQNIGCHIFFG
jgi:hypothetical protein